VGVSEQSPLKLKAQFISRKFGGAKSVVFGGEASPSFVLALGKENPTSIQRFTE